MNVKLSLPAINGRTEAEQLRQIKSWLGSAVPLLNFALSQLERTTVTLPPAPTPAETFGSVKSLIIKSAEIVESYYEKIDQLLKLSGEYVAQSQYGLFRQDTTAALSADSRKLELLFSDLQSVTAAAQALITSEEALSRRLEQTRTDLQDTQTALSGLESIRGIDAYLRFGLLEDGVYGLEIGQDTRENGITVFRRFLRLTADALQFFDENGFLAAEATGQRFRCPVLEAERLHLGGFLFFPRAGGNLSLRWTGE